MKKLKIVLSVIFVSLVLSACTKSEANDKLSKEQVLEKARTSFETLNSLKQKTKLLLDIDLKDNKNKQDIDMDATMIYDKNKKVDSIYTKTQTKQDEDSQTLGFYKASNKKYIDEGMGWTEYKEEENYSSTYKPTLDSFLISAKSMDMTETDTTYEFKYKGKDVNLLKSSGKPYNIDYDDLSDAKNVQLELKYVIDKSNMFLKEVDIKTKSVIDPENKISINGSSVFTDFNTITEVKRPEKLQ